MMNIYKLIGCFICVLLVGGCFEQSRDNQLTGYGKNGNSPNPVGDWFKEKSQYDYLYLTTGAWETPRMIGAADSLRALNPRINLGTYIPLSNVPQWMANADTSRLPGRWWRDLSQHFAITTEGDTASMWKKSFIFDVMDPKVRAIAIREIDRYVREQKLGHVMLDHCSWVMPDLLQYQPQGWQDIVNGDPDFDRDGLGYWDDLDEQEALRSVWFDYMDEMRAALPPDCKVIVNGGLAIKHPEFSKHVDGCYIEQFPWWFFGSNGAGYEGAMDPDYPTSLWNLCQPERWRDGKGTIFLEDAFNYDANAYISQCFDNLVLIRRWANDSDPEPSDPPVIDLGNPISGAKFKDGKTTREFEGGTIVIEVISNNSVRASVVMKGKK